MNELNRMVRVIPPMTNCQLLENIAPQYISSIVFWMDGQPQYNLKYRNPKKDGSIDQTFSTTMCSGKSFTDLKGKLKTFPTVEIELPFGLVGKTGKLKYSKKPCIIAGFHIQSNGTIHLLIFTSLEKQKREAVSICMERVVCDSITNETISKVKFK